ncbi:MAG: hypothetical protein EOP53_23385, partial [Sphingobacteriales bacterium]
MIESFSPDSSTIGTTVNITGKNFTNASEVSFGGVPATSFTVNSATSITAVVGAAKSGAVSLKTPFGITEKPELKFNEHMNDEYLEKMKRNLKLRGRDESQIDFNKLKK